MTAIVVRPVRFTDRIEEMQKFLETVGLRARLESVRGGWVDLIADSGMMALHDAATSTTGGLPGQTCLSFEANDLDALASQLRDAGVLDVTVYDESYGRVLTCTDPLGDQIAIDGRTDDLYGYRAHPETRPEQELAVVPVRFTDPQGPYASWLEHLGLTRVGDSNESYVMFDAGEHQHGYVGLHHVFTEDPADLPIIAGGGSVQLTFATHEPLDDVASRLAGAGFDDATIQRDFGAMLTVTDPDGCECQVHPSPVPVRT